MTSGELMASFLDLTTPNECFYRKVSPTRSRHPHPKSHTVPPRICDPDLYYLTVKVTDFEV